MILPSLVYRESTSLPMHRVSQSLCNLLPFHVLILLLQGSAAKHLLLFITRKYANYHLPETATNSARIHSLV